MIAALPMYDRPELQAANDRYWALIRAGLPPTQSPNLFTLGPAAAFLKQSPFSV